MLTKADKQIFKIYDSFKILDKKYGGALINTFWQCKLPKDYYFIRLEKYQKENAPLSKFYIYNPHSLFKEKLKKDSTKHIDKVESLIKDKSILIREALELARRVNVRAPYFKNMSEEDIYLFIERYKKNSDIN